MPEPISNFADFVTKAERRVGGAFTLAAVAIGLLGLYAIRATLLGLLGFAVTVIGGTLALIVAGALLVFLIMLALNPTIQTEIWHAQNGIARWVSNWAMKRDPFGRMRAFADEELGAQFKKFNKAAAGLEAGLTTTRQRIEKHTDTLNESNEVAAALKKHHGNADGTFDTDEHRDQYRLEAQRITFAEDTLKKLRASELRKITLLKIVDRWRSTFKFEIESTRMSAQFLEDQFNEADETANALEAASTAFGQSKLAKADERVREYVQKITSERMAQANVLMKQIPELTQLSDLKGDIAEDQLNARLAELDRESQRAFVGVQNDRRQIEAGGSSQITELIRQKTAEPVTSRRYLR